MANWKERGEVPDSDDDDDLDLESQPLSETNIHPSEPPATTQQSDAETSLHDAIQDGGSDGDDEVNSRASNVHQDTSADGGDILAQAESPAKLNTGNRGASPQPSLESPKAFKFPLAFPDLDDDTEGTLSDHEPEQASQPKAAAPVVNDEISQSYVRITSPSLSPLTNLSSSQESKNNEPNTSSQNGRPSFPENTSQDVRMGSTMERNSLMAPPAQSNANRRTFRQRNPIQLHPYVLEQEKYRRTFTSRGMMPMRLAQIQDEKIRRARHTSSPDPDSQEMDFEMEESQQMDLDWDPPSSPPLPQPSQNENETEVPSRPPSGESDDEFPDIDELLRAPIPGPRQLGPKRRVKTYTSKTQRPLLSKIETQNSRKPPNPTDIFNVPASPPQTSSPVAMTSHHARKSLSRTLSLSSKEATPTWLGQNELTFDMTADLPTPATSATKPISNLVVIESESELDDPFATDNDLSPAAASSSDESVQIRRVSKKIRGVLPASHLRLDQSRKKPAPPSRAQRVSLSLSPIKLPARRGVALARPSTTAGSPSTATHTGMHFLSDDSDDDENDSNGFVMEDDRGNELDQLFQREGSAEEDDRIDPMLPSKKRRPKALAGNHPKRRRLGSTTMSRNSAGGYSHQPKITEHLKQPRTSTKSSNSRRNREIKSFSGGPSRITVNRSKKTPPPRLSILDVTNISSHSRLDVPQFVRIAARTARSKIGQGKQSPSKKFIRLANREDTSDAQSVLQDWRDGKIQPRNVESPQESSVGPFRRPLGPIASNQQTRVQTTGRTRRPNHAPTGRVDVPRKLIVARGKQTSMNDFVTPEEPAITRDEAPRVERKVWKHPQKRTNRPHHIGPSARPAQLEASEIEYSRQNPSSAFRSTKKTLDAIYRTTRKRLLPQDNLQLGRFLADDNAVQPPVEISRGDGTDIEPTAKRALNHLRRKKRQPERVDVGAARYRQPSEPLILNFLCPDPLQDVPSEDSKLQGLGKFGTKYSLHFDMFPLQSGIYFHDSTFIGSGRLSKAINGAAIQIGLVRQYTSLRLGDKDFQWGPWNPTVSSEIGVCFDWVLDQSLSSSTVSTSPTVDTIFVMTFIVDYLQNYLSFTDPAQQTDFLTRIVEILEEFSFRVKGQLPTSQHAGSQGSQWIEMLNRCMIVGFHAIQIARTRPENSSLSFKAEDVLKNIASICIGHLLSHGIDGIRKLYDNLQYFSFRERGIRNDQYTVQSWVIAMQVLGAACIPRGSFWDVVNSVLIDTETKNTNDARIMEKAWYTMFSLLPLCEFDEFGFIKPGRRRKASFDNWSLPQQLLKRVFALYGSNPRQPPGFNDYCRALVSRCHHLMGIWAWWKCSGIIGAIFDFFASQKLGHLRNEEVYNSPRFLRELEKEPSLEVESEDRCFHIFLKIVGLAIKHMEKVKDTKGIRNLVARLLPNHDRQYPKEEAIHQRELASLRNHHDLLCTLYWAAPAEQRPAPALIQELVIADRSHKEACLINLRAWENLARFVVSNSSNPDLYQPFALWQNEFSSKLAQQYNGTESEVRHQAEILEKNDTRPISEALLKQTILANRRSTMETLRVMVRIMDRTVKAATSAQLAIQAFNPGNYPSASCRTHTDDS